MWRNILVSSSSRSLSTRSSTGSKFTGCIYSRGFSTSLSLSRRTRVTHPELLKSRGRIIIQSPYFSTDSSTSSSTTTTAPPDKFDFQAETKQLLEIVTHSLYTDPDVFLRELISNASDALEKMRHAQQTGITTTEQSSSLPLEIKLELDEVNSTISLTDTGIGMTKQDMIDHLGTIARSGSKQFLQALQQKHQTDGDDEPFSNNIIGKFGVGFYSSFMVGDKVEVRSQAALAANEKPHVWTSDGSGSYQIAELPEDLRQDRGTTIVIHLKEKFWEYLQESRIEKILKQYSNFIAFPIFLNGKRVNTLDALWVKDPKSVSDEEYTAFYKYIANAVDEPLDTYHFRADAPLDVKALFFVPSFHSEKYGMERMSPGVNLYSRKVLIEHKSANILPEWLRFIKGVVDSEDLPLSVSREKPQDSQLIAKLRRTLTRKFLAHLKSMVRKDREKYVDEFFREYSFFLKEGLCHDYEFQKKISELLFFETTKSPEDTLVSLDEYVSRMRPEQKDIYYIVAPTRDAILSSPYMEAFEKAGVEVLCLYSAIDDFVMSNLEDYEGRKLVSVEKSDIDLSSLSPKNNEDSTDDSVSKKQGLSKEEQVDFCNWFRTSLGDAKVASCTVTDRLSSSPAIVTDNESGAMRRMMRLVDTSEGNRDGIPLPKQDVQINPNHPLIVGIHKLRSSEPALARVLSEQIFDNCLVAAGLLDDGRSMLPRLNDILLCVVNGASLEKGGSTTPGVVNDE